VNADLTVRNSARRNLLAQGALLASVLFRPRFRATFHPGSACTHFLWGTRTCPWSLSLTIGDWSIAPGVPTKTHERVTHEKVAKGFTFSCI